MKHYCTQTRLSCTTTRARTLIVNSRATRVCFLLLIVYVLGATYNTMRTLVLLMMSSPETTLTLCSSSSSTAELTVHPEGEANLRTKTNAKEAMAVVADVETTSGTSNKNETDGLVVKHLDAKNDPIIISAAEWTLDPTDPCYEIMNLFHNQMACYRSYDGSACHHDDGHGDKRRNPPLYLHALYSGQGFGRVVSHTSQTCTVAMSLNRPCLVDLEPRDPYRTFRSFISRGTYDWDPDVVADRYKASIDDAIDKMERPEYGGWEKLVDDDRRDHRELHYSDIYPMRVLQNVSRDEYTQAGIDAWDAENGDSPASDKLLLVPNWGDGWFTKYRPEEALPRLVGDRCPSGDLASLIQNAMYRPTETTRMLFQQRKRRVLGEDVTTFGAIHLRTYFLNKHGMTSREMIQTVKACVKRHSSIEHWWIVSDDIDVARNVTEGIPSADIRHGYDDEVFNTNNVHSGFAGRKRFGHENMAPNVLDWMVLYESRLALISQDSAFSETGARGRHKVQLRMCGGVPNRALSRLKVYGKRNRS